MEETDTEALRGIGKRELRARVRGRAPCLRALKTSVTVPPSPYLKENASV